jgi:hypothetical protein
MTLAEVFAIVMLALGIGILMISLIVIIGFIISMFIAGIECWFVRGRDL